MNQEILELVTQQLAEIRLDSIMKKDDRYRCALQKEVEMYEKFLGSLSGGQKEEFENFLTASSESALVRERLGYQQGMKDLMALLRSLGESWILGNVTR